MPPIRFGTSRGEVLQYLGIPTSWCSKDDPLFQPPRRDYHTSNSISFGRLTFSFGADDAVESIMIYQDAERSFPPGSLFFPELTTTIHDIAELMRGQGILFKDISPDKDGSQLVTASGVEIHMSLMRGDEGLFLSCYSKKLTCQFEIRDRLVHVPRSAQAEGKFIHQMGTPGHYGHVILAVEPSASDGLIFDWAVAETVVPQRFSESVLRGIRHTCSNRGPFQGCTFTRTRVRVIGGSYHETDSRERAYEMASAMAFEDAVGNAGGSYLAI